MWSKHGAIDAVARLGVGISSFRTTRRKTLIDMILRVKSDRRMAMTTADALQLFNAAESVAKIDGAAAEVGVFQGASARIVLEALPDKTLHLFDTFAGMPDAQDGLDKGQYEGPLESVREYLNSPRVRFHKGYFPRDTGHEVADERFAFVHLDIDYYDGTLGALEFFWPRMNRGGVLITHDYGYPMLPGPAKAFAEFFKNRPEPVIELGGIQALVVKT